MREWVPTGPLFFITSIRVSMTANTKRYIRESALEARVAAIVEPVAQSLGYDLVRVRISNDNGCTLQIMCEDENGHFAITDCEKLHHDLNPGSRSRRPHRPRISPRDFLPRRRPSAGPGPRFPGLGRTRSQGRTRRNDRGAASASGAISSAPTMIISRFACPTLRQAPIRSMCCRWRFWPKQSC